MKTPSIHRPSLPLILTLLGFGLGSLVAQVTIPPAPDQAEEPAPTETAPTAAPERAPELDSDQAKAETTESAEMPQALVAVLTPTEGSEVEGRVTFEALDSGEVRVTARISGLKPNAKHAMHIHEFGDISSADGSGAGSHFNPDDTAHGLPHTEEHHPGDFGNLQSDAEGNATQVLKVRDLSLTEGAGAIVGRAVIVHEGEDKGTQPSGDAGDRLAQGVIAIAGPDSLGDDRVAASSDPDGTTTAAIDPEPAVPASIDPESATDPAETTLSADPSLTGAEADLDADRAGADLADTDPTAAEKAPEKTERSETAATPTSSRSRGAAMPAENRNTPVEELGEVAGQIGRGAEKAARTTVRAVERGVDGAGDVLRKVGKKVENAVD